MYEKRKNPYHNFKHAFSVLNTIFYVIKTSDSFLYFGDQGVAAMILSALCHDLDHPGNNNDFEINTNSELALKYNNKSVLENHHCFVFFSLLQNEKFNILKEMSKAEMNVFRNICVELFIMTDPKFHFEMLAKFQMLLKKFEKEEFHQEKNFECFISLAGNILHGADLCGPTRPREEALEWSKLISYEFESQQKKELEMGLQETQFFKDLQIPKKRAMNELFFVESIVKPLWVTID